MSRLVTPVKVLPSKFPLRMLKAALIWALNSKLFFSACVNPSFLEQRLHKAFAPILIIFKELVLVTFIDSFHSFSVSSCTVKSALLNLAGSIPSGKLRFCRTCPWKGSKSPSSAELWVWWHCQKWALIKSSSESTNRCCWTCPKLNRHCSVQEKQHLKLEC